MRAELSPSGTHGRHWQTSIVGGANGQEIHERPLIAHAGTRFFVTDCA